MVRVNYDEAVAALLTIRKICDGKMGIGNTDIERLTVIRVLCQGVLEHAKATPMTQAGQSPAEFY